MVWTVLSGVIALVAAVLGARPLGHALKRRPVRRYHIALIAIGIFAMAVILGSALIGPPRTELNDSLFGMGLGLGCGGLAGLRYGYRGVFEIAAVKDLS